MKVRILGIQPGTVTEGMDVVDAILADAEAKGISDGVAPVEDQPVITTIKILD